MMLKLSCALPYHQPQEVSHAGIWIQLKTTDKLCLRLGWCSYFDTLIKIWEAIRVSHHWPLGNKARHAMLKLCYLPEPLKESDSSNYEKLRYLQLIWNLSPNTLSNFATSGKDTSFLNLSSKYRLLNSNICIKAEQKSGREKVIAGK